MEIPLTLTGSAAPANPGEQRFLFIRACTWDRQDKGIGNRNIPVKDMTYWREKITLLSASTCSVVVYAILGISGLRCFKRSVNVWKVASESKLFGVFLSFFPYYISLKKLNQEYPMPTYSSQVCHTGSGVCDIRISLSLLKQPDKMPSLEVCPGALRLKIGE